MAVAASRDGSPVHDAPEKNRTRVRRTLGRHQRLTRGHEFREAFTQGPGYPGRFMVMRLRHGDDAALRLGLVTSKRALPRAVDRSRARRLLREAFRLNRERLHAACDVVLIARTLIRSATCAEVQDDLMKLCRRAGLLRASPRRKGSAAKDTETK